MVGGVVSTTVTRKAPVALLPCASVAEQPTEVWPSGNVERETGVQTTLTEPSTRSNAVAVYVTTAPGGPVASAVMSDGSVRDGGVVSTTPILKVPVATFPAASLAKQWTVVTPSGKSEPEGGVQTTGTGPSTSSIAVAVKGTVAPPRPGASTILLADDVSTGGTMSPPDSAVG